MGGGFERGFLREKVEERESSLGVDEIGMGGEEGGEMRWGYGRD